MKCSTCGKEIPATSQVCPFCYSTIEKGTQTTVVSNISNDNNTFTTINTTTVQESNNELNFGNLNNNTSYDNNSLKANILEPKKKNKLLLPILGVMLFFGLILVVLLIMNANKPASYSYYTGIVDKVYNYINDNYTGRDVKNAGSYKIYYTIDGETKEFKGEYQLDLHKKLLDITADLKNPEEERGGIVINDKTLKFEVVGKNSDLYFISEDLYEKGILLPYEDETGFLATKQYNLDVLVDGVHQAITAALKSMTYTEEKKIHANIRDNDMVVNKKVLKLDNSAKKHFVSVFYDTLLNDYNFISEYGKVKGKKAEEMEKILSNIKTTNEIKYSSANDQVSYLNLYYRGKEIYRLEYDNKNVDGTSICIDFDENKFTIDITKDNNSIFKVAVSRIDSYMNDILTRNYMAEFVFDGKPITINLELTKQNNPTIKVRDVQDIVSIRDFTLEQLDQLKTAVGNYTKYSDYVYKVAEIFGTVCAQDLSCVCNNDKTCQCYHNSSVITCPREIIELKKQQATNVTE